MSQKNLNKELDLLFRSLKVKKGDKVIIHSNISGIFQFYKKNNEDICDVFISYLKKYIGKKGVVVIPTYNYKFAKMKGFNVRTSISEVGFFSNYLLKKHWRKRTLDPIFSHVIFGKINNFDHKKINYEAFGVNSIFSIFKENNFKIICFCCPTNTMTFLHYLEYLFGVPYRYIKNFKGILINQKFKTEINYKYNVSKKNSNYPFQEHKINKLINQKDFIKSYFGRFECYSVDCNYLYYILKKKMKINKKFLIIK